jgi:hypothetical protein
MIIKRKSPFTGKLNSMEIPLTEAEYTEAVLKYNGGMLLQDVFPTLNADQREFIKTGYTSQDWATMFPEKDASEAFEAQKS